MSDRPEDRIGGSDDYPSASPVDGAPAAASAHTPPVTPDAHHVPRVHAGPPAPPTSYPAYQSQAPSGAFGQPTGYGSAGPSAPSATPWNGIPPHEMAPPAAAPGEKKPRRNAPLGLIAALAVGALVGGVSGAGVTAAVLANADSVQTGSGGATPTNITVNDDADATIITAVAAAAGPSVVTISVSNGSSGSGGTGSGVILSEDGYVLTNSHVVTLDGATGSPSVSVQTSDGRLYRAEIVGTDPISDLAVLKMDGEADFQAAEFADSDELNVGDTAIAIGAPLGLANTVTNGIVSSLNRSITVASSAVPEDIPEQAPDDQNGDQGPFDFWQFGTPDQQRPTTASSTISLSVIQTDAAINPGNSGGALLDADGKVIGINVAIASAGQNAGGSQSGSIGVGFAIPSNLAQRIAKEIIETGTGSHGLLGASVDDVDSAEADVVGALIVDVTPGGAADAAGLRAGDIVTRINDLPVTGRTDLTAQVRALAAGSEATITYLRDGKVDTVDVTLGSLG